MNECYPVEIAEYAVFQNIDNEFLDTTYIDINDTIFKRHRWVELHGNVKEAIPLNMLESRGKDVDLRMYENSDHAGDKSTLRSRTGFLIYTNIALIQWLSKKQPSIETSVLGCSLWQWSTECKQS